jgi:isoamylase
VLNSYYDAVFFKLPEAPEGVNWELLLDTNIPYAGGGKTFEFGAEYEVTGRSLLLFLMRR